MTKLMADRMDQVIEAQLSSLSTPEIAGAYRSLCGMMLALTAISFRRRKVSRKDEIENRSAARKWVSSRDGVITFGEVCEVLNLDSDRARQALKSVSGS